MPITPQNVKETPKHSPVYRKGSVVTTPVQAYNLKSGINRSSTFKQLS